MTKCAIFWASLIRDVRKNIKNELLFTINKCVSVTTVIIFVKRQNKLLKFITTLKLSKYVLNLTKIEE